MPARVGRGDDAELRQQLLAHGDELAAHRRRAGLDPKHRLRLRGQRQQMLQRVRRQFVEDMAQHQHLGRGGRRYFYRETRKRRAGALHREALCRAGAVMEREVMDLRRPGFHDATARDARATAPVEHGPLWERPAARFQLREHGVPLPADPLGEREIIAGQLAVAAPVVRAVRTVDNGFVAWVKLEEARPEPPERIPVHVRPQEVVRGAGVGFHKKF